MDKLSETIVQTTAFTLMGLCIVVSVGGIILLTTNEIYARAKARIRRKRGR